MLLKTEHQNFILGHLEGGKKAGLRSFKCTKDKVNKRNMRHILVFTYNWETGPVIPGQVRKFGPSKAMGLWPGKAPGGGRRSLEIE